MPITDAIFTIAPPAPCLIICLISYFRQSHIPLRSTAMVRSQSSSDCLMMGTQTPSMPALLNATSRRPNFSTVFWTSASTSRALVTSAFTNRPSPPTSAISFTVSLPSASRRPETTTLAPDFANKTAVSRPMPDVPPVTSATLLSNPDAMVCNGPLTFLQTSMLNYLYWEGR